MSFVMFTSLPRRLRMLGLMALLIAAAPILRSQNLIEYPAPVEEEFPARPPHTPSPLHV